MSAADNRCHYTGATMPFFECTPLFGLHCRLKSADLSRLCAQKADQGLLAKGVKHLITSICVHSISDGRGGSIS